MARVYTLALRIGHCATFSMARVLQGHFQGSVLFPFAKCLENVVKAAAAYLNCTGWSIHCLLLARFSLPIMARVYTLALRRGHCATFSMARVLQDIFEGHLSVVYAPVSFFSSSICDRSRKRSQSCSGKQQHRTEPANTCNLYFCKRHQHITRTLISGSQNNRGTNCNTIRAKTEYFLDGGRKFATNNATTINI